MYLFLVGFFGEFSYTLYTFSSMSFDSQLPLQPGGLVGVKEERVPRTRQQLRAALVGQSAADVVDSRRVCQVVSVAWIDNVLGEKECISLLDPTVPYIGKFSLLRYFRTAWASTKIKHVKNMHIISSSVVCPKIINLAYKIFANYGMS